MSVPDTVTVSVSRVRSQGLFKACLFCSPKFSDDGPVYRAQLRRVGTVRAIDHDSHLSSHCVSFGLEWVVWSKGTAAELL